MAKMIFLLDSSRGGFRQENPHAVFGAVPNETGNLVHHFTLKLEGEKNLLAKFDFRDMLERKLDINAG